MHDDGIYLASAHALANGAGYIVESLPGDVPQTKYPVLYPALIAVFWKFTNNLGAVAFLSKLVSMLSTAAWIFVLRRLLRRQLSNPTVADWIVFIGVSVPWAVYLSTSILPDTLFAFLTTLALDILLLAEKPAQPPIGWKSVIAVGVLTSAAFLIRTTGLALLLAALFVLLRRRFVFGLGFLALCAVACGPWLLWQASQPAPLDEVQLYYSKLSYAKGHLLAGYNAEQMFTIVISNLAMLSTFFIGALLAMPTLPALLVGATLAFFAVSGWFQDARRGLGILSVWLLLYGGILTVWVWPPYRYMLPFLPIALLYVAQGMLRLEPTLNRTRIVQGSLLIYSGAVLLANGMALYNTARFETTVVGWGKADKWSQQVQLAEWIKTSTPTDAIVAANLDPAVYLMTGRKSIRLFGHMPYRLFYEGKNGPSPVGGAEDIRRNLLSNRVTHLLLSPMKNFNEGEPFWKAFNQLKNEHPDAFRLVKRLPEEGYAVYEVNQAKLNQIKS